MGEATQVHKCTIKFTQIGSAFISHIFSDKNASIKDAVKSLEDKMMNNSGYLVNRDHPVKFLLDFLLGNAVVLFLFLFGKLTGLVIAIYPSNCHIHYVMTQ